MGSGIYNRYDFTPFIRKRKKGKGGRVDCAPEAAELGVKCTVCALKSSVITDGPAEIESNGGIRRAHLIS